MATATSPAPSGCALATGLATPQGASVCTLALAQLSLLPLLHSLMAQAKLQQCCLLLAPETAPPHTLGIILCCVTCAPSPALSLHCGAGTPSCPGQPRLWHHPRAEARGQTELPGIHLHGPQELPGPSAERNLGDVACGCCAPRVPPSEPDRLPWHWPWCLWIWVYSQCPRGSGGWVLVAMPVVEWGPSLAGSVCLLCRRGSTVLQGRPF